MAEDNILFDFYPCVCHALLCHYDCQSRVISMEMYVHSQNCIILATHMDVNMRIYTNM